MSENKEPTIKVIDIKHSYEENQECNYKDIPISQHIRDIQKIDYSYSRFEVIIENTNRIFFNIQGIDKNDTQLIFKMVNELKLRLFEFFIIKKSNRYGSSNCIDNYSNYELFDEYDRIKSPFFYHKIKTYITENIKSYSHKGRSYHVIFCNVSMDYICYNYSTPLKIIKDFINYYILNEYTGYQYIDDSIYSPGMLFRCVNQPGVNINAIDNKIELIGEDMHRHITNTTIDMPNPYDVNLYKDLADNIGCSLINCHMWSKDEDEPILYLYKRKLCNAKLSSIFEEQAKIIKNKSLQKDKSEETESESDKEETKIKTYKVPRSIIRNNLMKRINPSDTDDSDEYFDEPTDDENKTERQTEQQTGEDEYNKAAILSYVLKDDLNTNMQTALKGIVEYYNKNKNFDNFELNLKQIQILESMVENKL